MSKIKTFQYVILQSLFMCSASLAYGRYFNVAEYNVDKNGTGQPSEIGIEPQIALVASKFNDIDVLGLIEVQKNCPASGGIDGPKVFADGLGLPYHYYSVEFTLKNGEQFSNCTEGNAILSKYPLDLFLTKPFKSQCCGYSHREGQRIMSIGHISPSHLGTKKGLFFILVHLEAGRSDFNGIVEGINTRFDQVNLSFV